MLNFKNYLIFLLFKICSSICLKELNSITIQNEIFNKIIPSLVIYHDKNRPPLDEFINKMESYDICVSYFDCSEKSNAKVCQGARISHIPSVVLYTDTPQLNPYTKKRTNSIKRFN